MIKTSNHDICCQEPSYYLILLFYGRIADLRKIAF